MTTVESLRAEFDQVGVDLAALHETLPPRTTEQPEPYTNGRGEQVEAHRGWTDEERAQVQALRDRQRALALELARLRADQAVAPSAE